MSIYASSDFCIIDYVLNLYKQKTKYAKQVRNKRNKENILYLNTFETSISNIK